MSKVEDAFQQVKIKKASQINGSGAESTKMDLERLAPVL